MLDTNVVSEFRRERPHGAVLAWVNSVSTTDLYLSVVTLGELQAGIEKTRKSNPQRAVELEIWLERLILAFKLLPMETRTFRTWARLMQGRPDHMGLDAMIAATAACHGFTIVTRNIKDFILFGVPVLDPFAHPKT